MKPPLCAQEPSVAERWGIDMNPTHLRTILPRHDQAISRVAICESGVPNPNTAQHTVCAAVMDMGFRSREQISTERHKQGVSSWNYCRGVLIHNTQHRCNNTLFELAALDDASLVNAAAAVWYNEVDALRKSNAELQKNSFNDHRNTLLALCHDKHPHVSMETWFQSPTVSLVRALSGDHLFVTEERHGPLLTHTSEPSFEPFL